LRVAISSRSSCREAAAAIPAMTGSEQLNCEALHWRYIRRYRPQLARLAHGMAGGGSRDDFRNPEFVQEWSCFIFYVLNTDPQQSRFQKFDIRLQASDRRQDRRHWMVEDQIH
jgi:hypothetical protein